MYGWPMSVLAREDALQGDDPVEDEVRGLVRVRLAFAHVRDAAWLKRGRGSQRRIGIVGAGKQGAVRVGLVRVRTRRTQHVRVVRHLRDRERVRVLTGLLAENVAAAAVRGAAPAQGRQREVDSAVAAVGGPEQREQRLVLVDRQELAVAGRPT